MAHLQDCKVHQSRHESPVEDHDSAALSEMGTVAGLSLRSSSKASRASVNDPK